MTKYKKYIIWVGIAVVIILLYLYYKSKAKPAAPVVTTVNPVTGQSTTAATALNGTVEVPKAVTDWANGLQPNNKAQFYKMLPTMTQQDIDGLYDIILNEWGANRMPTPAQTTFWNYWRVKYHVADGSIIG